jgi:hypothetical protein
MNSFSFLHVEYLQAAVWTVVLSLVAFVFGGVAGFVDRFVAGLAQPLCCATSPAATSRWCKAFRCW